MFLRNGMSPGRRRWVGLASDLALVFGLGKDTVAKTVEIRWPSGQVDRMAGVKADQFLTVKEGGR
jgi:hypothetical protein